MEYGAVLDVHSVADADGVHIAPKYGIEPYATVSSHYYVANNRGVVGQITVFADLRSKSSDRFYKCHKLIRLIERPKLVDFWEFSMIFVGLAAAFSVEVEC